MSANGAPARFRARVPRYRLPSVLDHLRRSGATFETGATDHERHTVEVFTSPAGAELLEQARAAGDRQRMGELYARLMLTPHNTPPGSSA